MDWLGFEALRLTAAAFRRCGYSSRELSTRFRALVETPFGTQRPPKPDRGFELHDVGHIFTLWASDPQYVDGSGTPRPLTMRGPAPSIEALVKRVRPKLRLQKAIHYLIATEAVRKVGRKYLPTGEYVHHAAEGTTQSRHHLLVLYQLVRNFEFNSREKRREDTWPQRVAECPDFPAHELPALIAALRRRITSFTLEEDRTMSRIARTAPATARRVRPAVSLFVSVVEPAGTQINRPAK